MLSLWEEGGGGGVEGVVLLDSPIFVQSGVWNFKVGDRVWGATDPFKGGCQVEYTAVNEVHSSAIYISPYSLPSR